MTRKFLEDILKFLKISGSPLKETLAAAPKGSCGVFFESEKGEFSPENPAKLSGLAAGVCKSHISKSQRVIEICSLSYVRRNFEGIEIRHNNVFRLT